jgi:hypothetical protein
MFDAGVALRVATRPKPRSYPAKQGSKNLRLRENMGINLPSRQPDSQTTAEIARIYPVLPWESRFGSPGIYNGVYTSGSDRLLPAVRLPYDSETLLHSRGVHSQHNAAC